MENRTKAQDLNRLLHSTEFSLKFEGAQTLLEVGRGSVTNSQEYKRRPFQNYAWATFHLIELLGSPDLDHRELSLALLPKITDDSTLADLGALLPSFFQKVRAFLLIFFSRFSDAADSRRK